MPYTLKTGRIKVKNPTTGEYDQFDASAEPIVDTALSGTSENPVQNKAVKNALDGKYTKPQTGIPSTDMSQAVQTSLGKADTALQESDIHAPLSKIFDTTLEEEAALTITEIDGELLSAEELHMEVFIPSGNIANGNVQVYSDNIKIGDGYHGAVSNIQNRYWVARWTKQGGIWVSECNSSLTSSNSFQSVQKYWISEALAWTLRSCIEYPKITKISVPVLPAGTSIRFYAR